MSITAASARGRAARFFFMHLGSLVAVVVYFHLCGASGYSVQGVRSALLTALVVKSGYMALAYWQGEHKHFDFGIWTMFAVGTTGAYLGIEPVFELFRWYSPAILFATLGLTAIAPLLLGREPFTYYYARRQLPRWQLKTSDFRAISIVMTLFWAWIFFTGAALCLYSPRDPLFTFLLPNLLVFLVGIPAQWWLPPLYLKLFPPKLPDTAEPLIMAMPMVFNAKVAGDARASIQFQVSGAEPGAYWLRVAGGRCESFEGVTDSADLTVHTPDTVWVRIAHGQLDGAKALAEGLYAVQGDLLILAKMREWFAAAR
jgi:putative sterol carrier protein